MSALNAIRQIDYTIIFTRDMPSMRRFYEQVMTFPVIRELGPDWVEFAVGANKLTLTRHGLMFNDAAPPQGALSLQLAFRVAPAQVADCAAALEAGGINLTLPLTDQPWGHRTIFFRDPDGNVIEIYAEI